MPGEDNLVYVAGHRTTFAAPFSHIDELRRRLPSMLLTRPYDERRLRRHRATGIVAATDLSVPAAARPTSLLALQACHPRFFATQRYIVWARLRGGRDARGASIPLPAWLLGSIRRG